MQRMQASSFVVDYYVLAKISIRTVLQHDARLYAFSSPSCLPSVCQHDPLVPVCGQCPCVVISSASQVSQIGLAAVLLGFLPIRGILHIMLQIEGLGGSCERARTAQCSGHSPMVFHPQGCTHKPDNCIILAKQRGGINTTVRALDLWAAVFCHKRKTDERTLEETIIDHYLCQHHPFESLRVIHCFCHKLMEQAYFSFV